jgi:hypothetical protein
MYKHYKLVRRDNAWAIVGYKAAGAGTEATWVLLGGCPNYLVALRVYMAFTIYGDT